MHACAPDARPQITESIIAARPSLLERAQRLVGASDAEDLVQNTIERALVHIDDFAPNSNVMAWLHTIMFNLTIDDWRRYKRHFKLSLEPEDLPAPAVSPDEPTPWQGLTLEHVRAAARGLSAAHRQVFELHHEWGLRYAEIGRRLHLPAGTVATRLMRARKQLRQALTKVLEAGIPSPSPARSAAPVTHLESRPRRPEAATVSGPSTPSLAAVA
jgi:RNA polymerase sigma-70 factor (ECF subfamily)